MPGVLALVAIVAADGELMAARVNAKNRRERGGYSAMPHTVLASQRYIDLSLIAVKLLHDLHFHFRGKNNGDLSAAWTLMKPRGWKSRSSLFKARDELLQAGFIKITRMGGRRVPHLYALTYLAIDECNGKLDCASTRIPSNEWKLDLVAHVVDHLGPPHGTKHPALRVVR
jgi:hypothetical protein